MRGGGKFPLNCCIFPIFPTMSSFAIFGSPIILHNNSESHIYPFRLFSSLKPFKTFPLAFSKALAHSRLWPSLPPLLEPNWSLHIGSLTDILIIFCTDSFTKQRSQFLSGLSDFLGCLPLFFLIQGFMSLSWIVIYSRMCGHWITPTFLPNCLKLIFQ